ncbi:molybdenum cofactor guanylyltransferase [Deinococcus sonorensis]|uniref:Molybdenum cofactor guanylyltransferase n=2 Tax=Deinococcus sonorensis TaxID=309891 RepID=A0AAU7U7T6_9DEIO
MDHAGCAAAITAGGQSRRYGSDKALARFEGQTLLERVALSLAWASPRLLVAPPGRYRLAGWQATGDLRPGQGPLAGLEAALSAAPDGWLAFAAVDLPHLTPGYWRTLTEQRQPGALAVCGQDEAGRSQPLAALYHTSALPVVRRLLDAEERRMSALLEQLPTIQLPWATLAFCGPQLYRNANRPEDLLG